MFSRLLKSPTPTLAISRLSSSSLWTPRTQQASIRHAHTFLRAHLDYRRFESERDVLQSNIINRGFDAHVNLDKVISLYKEIVSKDREMVEKRQKRNKIINTISSVKDKQEKDKMIAEGRVLKDELSAIDEQLEKLRQELETEALKVPNDLHPKTPIGPEGSGIVLKVVGDKPAPFPEFEDHLSFGLKHDLIDLEAASAVSGARFYYLKNEVALLEIALINFAMSKLVARGYTPIIPPDLIQPRYVAACGFQPRDVVETSQVYHIEGHDLALAGTAEIPLAGLYANTEFESKRLTKRPVKHVAFGHAFRTEAGTSGMAVKGLYRVHQFSKVEIFAVCTPEQSEELFEEIVQIQQEIISDLGLHYHVLEIPSGDLGAPAYRKIDLEAWMPGRNSYGEISSASNCTDYQARRLNIRFRDSTEEKPRFAHTLNGTAAAIPRLIISILEQHQRKDGTVEIPPILRPFMMGTQVIPNTTLIPHRERYVPKQSEEEKASQNKKKEKK